MEIFATGIGELKFKEVYKEEKIREILEQYGFQITPIKIREEAKALFPELKEHENEYFLLFKFNKYDKKEIENALKSISKISVIEKGNVNFHTLGENSLKWRYFWKDNNWIYQEHYDFYCSNSPKEIIEQILGTIDNKECQQMLEEFKEGFSED